MDGVSHRLHVTSSGSGRGQMAEEGFDCACPSTSPGRSGVYGSLAAGPLSAVWETSHEGPFVGDSRRSEARWVRSERFGCAGVI